MHGIFWERSNCWTFLQAQLRHNFINRRELLVVYLSFTDRTNFPWNPSCIRYVGCDAMLTRESLRQTFTFQLAWWVSHNLLTRRVRVYAGSNTERGVAPKTRALLDRHVFIQQDSAGDIFITSQCRQEIEEGSEGGVWSSCTYACCCRLRTHRNHRPADTHPAPDDSSRSVGRPPWSAETLHIRVLRSYLKNALWSEKQLLIRRPLGSFFYSLLS